MSELVIWSAQAGKWLSCPADEITWLDRNLLSNGEDHSLHRSPRCPAFRYVHYRWELFSRDSTHSVYVASFTQGAALDHHAVERAACYVLPAARAPLETEPVRLDPGSWLISVGKWVLPLCINAAAESRDEPTVPPDDGLPTTQGGATPLQRPGSRPTSDAVARVTRYFQRNPTACMAMAYYYQHFIRGAVAPQTIPMTTVAIALDLRSEGTVSEYKKELQRRIWNGSGHQRELGQFLLTNHLITQADLDRAIRVAAANEASGRTDLARKRLRYGSKRLRLLEPGWCCGSHPVAGSRW